MAKAAFHKSQKVFVKPVGKRLRVAIALVYTIQWRHRPLKDRYVETQFPMPVDINHL